MVDMEIACSSSTITHVSAPVTHTQSCFIQRGAQDLWWIREQQVVDIDIACSSSAQQTCQLPCDTQWRLVHTAVNADPTIR